MHLVNGRFPVFCPWEGGWGRFLGVSFFFAKRACGLSGTHLDPCEATGHKMETVHDPGPTVQVYPVDAASIWGCCTLLAQEQKSTYGDVTEELIVLILLLCSLVPLW